MLLVSENGDAMAYVSTHRDFLVAGLLTRGGVGDVPYTVDPHCIIYMDTSRSIRLRQIVSRKRLPYEVALSTYIL